MFNTSYVENAPEGGVAMLEVLGKDAQTMAFVPMRRIEISGEVTGPVAGMQVVHVFSYTKQQCSRVIEAAYRFPLPGDAAVTGVSVRFGDVEIQAVLEPRAQAEKDYEDAKKDRRQAALVTREAADVFTLRVAGIKPGQDVRVETAFVQLARAEGSGWSLRIPLTVPVRYTRGDESPAAGAARPLAQAADPGYRASLDLTVFDASGVASPTHALSLTRDGTELHARFESGDVLPDCDAVITWQPAGDAQRTTLSAFTAHREGRTPFLALVTPPSREQKLVPRELTVLVDHSGSMEGAKWDAADWAVKRLIGMLTEDDRFRIGVFHNTVTWWSDAPKAMDDAARKDAVHFLESHKDSGGTELGVALEQALHGQRPVRRVLAAGPDRDRRAGQRRRTAHPAGRGGVEACRPQAHQHPVRRLVAQRSAGTPAGRGRRRFRPLCHQQPRRRGHHDGARRDRRYVGSSHRDRPAAGGPDRRRVRDVTATDQGLRRRMVGPGPGRPARGQTVVGIRRGSHG